LNPALHTSPGGRLQGSALGTANQQRSLSEDWSALARVVQQPTCELVREGRRTYLQLRLPGVRTREMDSRQVHLRAFHQTRDRQAQPYSRQAPPARWQENSAAWAAVTVVASQEEEALTLQLPISEAQQTSDFAFALNIRYQLEAERNLFHHTNFVLCIAMVRGVRLPAQGRFTLDAVDTLPSGLDKALFWGCKREEMAPVDD
jgi:hypothetical protein